MQAQVLRFNSRPSQHKNQQQCIIDLRPSDMVWPVSALPHNQCDSLRANMHARLFSLVSVNAFSAFAWVTKSQKEGNQHKCLLGGFMFLWKVSDYSQGGNTCIDHNMVDPRLMQLSLMSRLAHPWRMVFLPALQCPLKPIKPFKLLWQIVWFRPGSNCLGIMIVGGFKHEWCSIFRKIPWVTPQAGVGVGCKIYLRYNYELHPTSAH